MPGRPAIATRTLVELDGDDLAPADPGAGERDVRRLDRRDPEHV